MKKIPAVLVIISLLSITFIACNVKEKKIDSDDSKEVKQDVSSLNEDAYSPGHNPGKSIF